MAQPPAIYFAVTRERTAKWDWRRPMREQDEWDEHASFMDDLVDRGIILLGGPLEDGKNVLHIFNVAGKDETLTLLAEDPWTTNGLLSTTRVERWEVLLDPRRR
jgi:uncharacterized protein